MTVCLGVLGRPPDHLLYNSSPYEDLCVAHSRVSSAVLPLGRSRPRLLTPVQANRLRGFPGTAPRPLPAQSLNEINEYLHLSSRGLVRLNLSPWPYLYRSLRRRRTANFTRGRSPPHVGETKSAASGD